MARRPKITDPHELFFFSDEHLRYEILMFFAASQKMAEYVRSPGPSATSTDTPMRVLSSLAEPSWFLRMATIEAFVMHLRALIGFLYPDEVRPRDDDVVAHDFLAEPGPGGPSQEERWLEARQAMSDGLRAAKRRADKELAHLTSERLAGVPETKRWPVEELAKELVRALATFRECADPERLGDEIRTLLSGIGQPKDATRDQV